MVKYVKASFDFDEDRPLYTNNAFLPEIGSVKVQLYRFDDDYYEIDVEANSESISDTDYVMDILKDYYNISWNAESYDEGVRYVDNIVNFLHDRR